MKRILCAMLAVLLLFGMCGTFVPDVYAAAMSASADAVAVIKKTETFSKFPYWDAKQYTVGYGTKCPDDKYEYYAANGITEEEATALLQDMLADFETAVSGFAGRYDLVLSQNQFDALVCFSYNCGTGWLSETDGTFNKAVRNGAVGTEFIYAICLWSVASGEFSLIKRRLSEANMYLNGVYEAYNDDTDGTYPDTYKYVFLDGNGGKTDYIIHGYDALDSSGVLTPVSAPDGTDYQFAGWYTASSGGTRVESLDGSLADGTVLYAHWQDGQGQPVTLPKGEICSVPVTVTGSVNVRTGPGTYYPKAQEAQLTPGTSLTITETYTYSGVRWGKCQYGWISLAYTDFEDVLASWETWPKTGYVNYDYVNVRSGAGTDNPVQYQLKKNDVVVIYEKTYAGGLYWGRMEDENWVCLTYVTFYEDNTDTGIPGDFNSDLQVTDADAIYLLRHTLFSANYPIAASGDVNSDGVTNDADAIYLLRHTLFPEVYPLYPAS